MRVTLRPLSADDIRSFYGREPMFRVRGAAAIVDDDIIGVGGIEMRPGMAIAFLDVKPEARRYRVALHRAAQLTLATAKRNGLVPIYAFADPEIIGSERWLRRLGFVDAILRGQRMFKWQG